MLVANQIISKIQPIIGIIQSSCHHPLLPMSCNLLLPAAKPGITNTNDTMLEKIFSNIQNNGGLLVIDYAKTNGPSGDTLQALSKHKKVSIFHKPGESDLTSHVDFNQYSYISKKNNIQSYGPITQRDFLIGLGIDQRYQILRENSNDSQLDKLYRQYHRLIDKDKMGELFKVMYFSNNPKTVPITIT